LCFVAFLFQEWTGWKPAVPGRLVRHSQCREVEVEQRVAFFALVGFHFADADDLAHDLGIEALALGLCVDFLEVIAQGSLFFLETLDAFDQ